MTSSLRRTTGSVALMVLALSACSDTELVTPASQDVTAPASLPYASSYLDEVEDFFFLPPLAEKNPTITGEFNPNLAPSLSVCEIGDLAALQAGSDCLASSGTEIFAAGSAEVQSGQYVFSWDTSRRETPNFSNYYQLQIKVADVVVGRLNLDPQKPNGPGRSEADGLAYAFRVGETIPVKVWIGTDVLCVPSAEVIECITGAVVGQNGADLSLESQGAILGLNVEPDALPAGTNAITVVLERINSAELVENGMEVDCLPMFDAPQFGECFRITASPEVTLTRAATVSICVDPGSFAFSDGSTLTIGQQKALQMIRYNDGAYEAMRDAEGDCTPAQLAALEAASSGVLFDFENDDEDGIGDDGPSADRPIRLGGFTSSFSRFRFALTGLMIADDSEFVVQQTSSDPSVETFVRVEDALGNPVQDAIVRFDGQGTASPAEVTTGIDGVAATTWTVDTSSPGEKTLTASALGLSGSNRPNEDGVVVDGVTENEEFSLESVEITATVVGPPAQFGESTTDPTPLPDGTEVGGPVGTVTVVVQDAASQGVEGATVTWGGDGFVGTSCAQDADGNPITPCTTTTTVDGSTTATWTLGTAAGEQTITATVDGIDGEITFTVVAAPGEPFGVAVTPASTPAAPIEGAIGEAVPVTATVTDLFGNPIGGESLTWTSTAGSGSITGDAATGTDGVANGLWTLGLFGNAATVSTSNGVEGFFYATGACVDGFGVANADGIVSGDEWACARSETATVNLGGGAEPATLSWMNDEERVYFLLQVDQASGEDIFSLRFDLDSDGVSGPSAGDRVVGLDTDRGTTFGGSLSNRCAKRSQSSCFSDDGSGVEVEAAVDNADGTTTYELSAPMPTAGTDFGFFFTLSNGNGAKGNTQYPGFRDYRIFMPVVITPGS